MKAEKKRRMNVFEMECFRGMVGATFRDRINNDHQIRTGKLRQLEDRVDSRVLEWAWTHGEEGRWEIGEKVISNNECT